MKRQWPHVLFFLKLDQKKIIIDYLIYPNALSGNDIGSLKHVIERRLKYYDDPKTKPDLIIN